MSVGIGRRSSMRSYATNALVTLPTLRAAGPVALGQGLLTVAGALPLPNRVAGRRAALEAAQNALRAAFTHHLELPGGNPILDRLVETSQAYGEALGSTVKGLSAMVIGLRDLIQFVSGARHSFPLQPKRPLHR